MKLKIDMEIELNAPEEDLPDALSEILATLGGMAVECKDEMAPERVYGIYEMRSNKVAWVAVIKKL